MCIRNVLGHCVVVEAGCNWYPSILIYSLYRKRQQQGRRGCRSSAPMFPGRPIPSPPFFCHKKDDAARNPSHHTQYPLPHSSAVHVKPKLPHRFVPLCQAARDPSSISEAPPPLRRHKLVGKLTIEQINLTYSKSFQRRPVISSHTNPSIANVASF
jgi:hypothetical protein